MKSKRIKKNILISGIGSLCLMASLMGCSKTGSEGKNEMKNLSGQYQKEKTKVKENVTEAFSMSYADFSVHLLKESREFSGKDAKNTMVSPLSVMTALEMTRTGADGETQKQMEQVLYGGLSGEEGRSGLLSFTEGLSNSEGASYIGANSIWFQSGTDGQEPKQEFLEKNSVDFRADIFSAPFDKSTVADINDWVSEKTDGNIPEILDEIPKDAKMYLINASSFDAEWWTEYNENDILEDEEFICADGTTKKVDLMAATEWEYICGDHETGFRKAYKDGYSFVALLPDEEISIDDYVNQLDGTNFLKLVADSQEEKVYTKLPAFESDTSLELSDALEALGMPRAFDEDQAEFQGIFADEDEKTWIGRVLHRTHIKVDARGTKAGAATVVEVARETAVQEEPKEVYLTRPFVYAIVENETNLPVFVGVVEDIGE